MKSGEKLRPGITCNLNIDGYTRKINPKYNNTGSRLLQKPDGRFDIRGYYNTNI